MRETHTERERREREFSSFSCIHFSSLSFVSSYLMVDQETNSSKFFVFCGKFSSASSYYYLNFKAIIFLDKAHSFHQNSKMRISLRILSLLILNE